MIDAGKSGDEVTIYLLCFDRRYKHARHYLGSAADLGRRLAEHRAGRGARLMAVILAAGIGFRVARTWKGTRATEKELKARHAPFRLCPFCNRGLRAGRGRDTIGTAPASGASDHDPLPGKDDRCMD